MWQNNRPPIGERAFALIEVVLVIILLVVLAILAAIGFVIYSDIMKHARDARRKSDLATLRTALEMYYYDTNTYPGPGNCDHKSPGWIDWSNCNNGSWDDSSDNIVARLEGGGYVKKMPKDSQNKGGPSDTKVNPENYTYGYMVWPSGPDAAYYLCANLETEVGTIQYNGYNYCVKGGCISCH